MSLQAPSSGRSTSTSTTPAPFKRTSASSITCATPGSSASQKRGRGSPRRRPCSATGGGVARSPVRMPSSVSRSSTLWAIGPAVSRVVEIGAMPRPETRPTVGRKPKTPHSADGTRTEPPVSVPSAAGTRPAATATPEPPLLPPGIRSGAHGLRAVPVTALWVVMPSASSCMLVLPAISAPALRSRSTTPASRRTGLPSNAVVPFDVATPATSMLSFTAIGTPSSGAVSPAARRASASRAWRRSASGSKFT